MITVLAHPAAGSFPGEGHYSEVLPPVEIVERLLPRFLDMGLHGLENKLSGSYLESAENAAGMGRTIQSCGHRGI